MRNLLIGSALAFVGLTGIVIKATALPNTDFYIKQVDKDYNDFLLTQFDRSNLIYGLEEEIYPKNNQSLWQESDFNYQISPQESKQYNENWKLDLFCATNPQTPLEECNVVGQRKVQYLQNLEMLIFFMQKLYNVNRYPGLLIFVPLLLIPFFLKSNDIENMQVI